MTATVVQTTGIMRRPYALTTVGTWSLSFLAAFEALAVTTIMPIVTADLDGRALYSLTFSATLAAGIVGMVVAGSWADSRGPAVPLLTAIVLFGAGLAIAGTASSMVVFVAGRFLQGLGAGGITVALYVLIAKVYPAGLHIKIFSAFAAAWVLPSMVGPFVAGVVTDVFSWHWVFLGVVVLVAASAAMLVPAVRRIEHEPPRGPAFDARRVAAAVVVALAVVVRQFEHRVGPPDRLDHRTRDDRRHRVRGPASAAGRHLLRTVRASVGGRAVGRGRRGVLRHGGLPAAAAARPVRPACLALRRHADRGGRVVGAGLGGPGPAG